jgi:hypothetical protein
MIHKVLMPELLAIRYGYHRAANAQFISNRLSEGLLLARGGPYPDFRFSGVSRPSFGPLSITF